MLFKEVLNRIPELKEKKLPGAKAHNCIMDMSLRAKIFEAHEHKTPHKESAVLALIYPDHRQQARMVFILRKSYEGHHSGQISFPGGKKETIDASLYETALRETREEIGVDSQLIQPVKQLSEVFIPVSNFLVQPFLAVMRHTPAFIKDPVEVEEILELPLQALLSHQLVPVHKSYFDRTYRLYAFQVGEIQIWGATAMILAEIRSLFGFEL